MLYLARRNQVFNRAGDLFDRHMWIDAMRVKQIDSISAQPPQRRVRDLSDVRRSAIKREDLQAN